MSNDRDELVALVRSLTDDTVPMALELLRGLFVGAEAPHAAEWRSWRRNLMWTCHACGDERPDDKISVASATFPIRGGVEGQVNRRYCNDRPACTAKARVEAAEMAARIGGAGG